MFPSHLQILLESTRTLDKEIVKIFCSTRNKTWNKSTFTTWDEGPPTHDGSALLMLPLRPDLPL